WTVIFGGLWLTCRYVSVRFGTGKLRRDFGFAWRPSDLWRGLVAYIVATILAGIVTSPWAGHADRLHYMMHGLSHVSWLAFAVFACSAVIAAPIFEELAFRGMLQRTLADRVGQRGPIGGQAAAFDEPRGATARQAWDAAGGVAELVAPDRQARFEREGGGFQVVPVVAGRAAELVPLGVHRGRRHGQRWCQQREHARLERQRFQDLADTLHAGPATDETERDVGAEGQRDRRIRATGPPQHSRSVGRTAAEAGADRYPLLQAHERLTADGVERT